METKKMLKQTGVLFTIAAALLLIIIIAVVYVVIF